MSEQPSSNNIPAGFTPETWAQLTPEQKQVYLQSQNQGSADAMQEQQEKMVKDRKKKAFLGMIFGSITSFLPRIIRNIFKRD